MVKASSVVNYTNSLIDQPIDVDKVNGPQCMDFTVHIMKYFFNWHPSGNAIDLISQSIPNGFSRFQVSNATQIKAGDVLIWGTYWNALGHTGIAVENGKNDGTFKAVEQNWNNPNWQNGSPAKLVTHNMTGVWGVIRPNYEAEDTPPPKINELGNITYFSRDDHMAIGVDFNPNQKGIVEFKMESYNLGTKQWKTIMDWNKANWGEWHDNKGDYWFHVKMRDGYTGVILAEKTISFAYKPGNARITAKNVSWQDDRTILIGCTAFPSTAQIKVKLYNVNTQQWFQTFTGSWSSFVPDPNTSYVAKFEVYTAKGYLADESSYGFSGKK